MGNPNVIGRIVRLLRKERGWTQEQLAAHLQLAHYWVTREVVANIETQRSGVPDTAVRALARVFKVPMADLFPKDE